MATYTDNIKVVIDVVTDNAKAGFQKFKTDIREADGVVGKFKAGAAGIGPLIAANATMIGAAGVAIVGGMYKMAEGAAETEAAFASLNQIAGSVVANKVKEWAKDGAEQFGMSERDIFKYSTSLANIGASAKMSETQMQDFISTHLTLAADLSAFANTSPSAVMQDLQAAYAGSAETLQKYGIFAQETNLKNAIFAETGEKVTGMLTTQQRVMGINLLAMEKGAQISGQYARESDSLSGQQARLKANFTNMSDTIGKAVLPAVTSLAEALIDMQDELAGAATVIATTIETSGKLAEALDAIGGSSKKNLEFLDEMGLVMLENNEIVTKAEAESRALEKAVIDLADADKQATILRAEGTAKLAEANEVSAEAIEKAVELGEKWNNATKEALGLTSATEAKAEADRQAARLAELHAEQVDILKGNWEQLKQELSERSAYLDLQDDFDAVETAAKEAWEAASTGAEDAEAKGRDYERTVLALKQRVIDYGAEIEDLPPERVTDIVALIDQGKFTEAEAALAELERTRIINLRINTGQIQAALQLLPGNRYASGTDNAHPGLALVGEQGPELVAMQGGEQVVNAKDTKDILRNMGGPNVTIVNHFPAGIDPNAAARALERHVRRQGPYR